MYVVEHLKNEFLQMSAGYYSELHQGSHLIYTQDFTHLSSKQTKNGERIIEMKKKRIILFIYVRFSWDVAGVCIWTHELRNISIFHNLNKILGIKNLTWNCEQSDIPFEGVLSLNYSKYWVLI